MQVKPTQLTGNILMVIAAALWGFTFVAQKAGMDYLGPFTFSAIRFVVGASCLLLLLPWLGGKQLNREGIVSGLIMGVIITFGISLQQIGIVETTAGKSGFLTAIYILLVPMFLSFAGKKLPLQTWPAAFMALAGIYFLSFKDIGFASINRGDYWVLGSSVFWALHILFISKSVRKHDPLRLSIVQFYTCGALSFLAVLIFEPIIWEDILTGIKGGWLELAYGSIASVAIAFTLQVFAQRSVPSHHAAMILSLEAVFAVIGGILLLDEVLTLQMVLGFLLIFAGIILAQYDFKSTRQIAANKTP